MSDTEKTTHQPKVRRILAILILVIFLLSTALISVLYFGQPQTTEQTGGLTGQLEEIEQELDALVDDITNESTEMGQ